MPGHGGGQYASHHRFRPSLTVCFFALGTLPAHAQGGIANLPLPPGYTPTEFVLLIALTGSILFAIVCAVLLIMTRGRARQAIQASNDRADDLRFRIERAESLLDASDQRIVIFEPARSAPLVMGNLGDCDGVPIDDRAFLAFGHWLTADSAGRLDQMIRRLRDYGEAFNTSVETNRSVFLECAGRVAGAMTYVRFSELSSERRDHAELQSQFARLKRDAESIGALLEALPNPVWVRNEDGRLTWINNAYATYVGSDSPDDVVKSEVELLDSSARTKIATQQARDGLVTDQFSVVVDGERRQFDVTDKISETGGAGIAIDISELERAKDVLRRTLEFHARTLDGLATAVAIFGPDRKLRYYNTAYQELWNLDLAYLESAPEDGEILDELRAARKLEEHADYRSWKADLMETYRSVDGKEQWWHLPDGQSLRVLANPHPQGGVTYVYENVTERLALESRFNAMIRVQRETLENLSEGVAVFGPDGRLRLWNPAFSEIWKIAGSTLEERPHASEIVEWCAGICQDPDAWQRLVDAITAMTESRAPIHGRMERRNSSVIDYATVPLPDGATLTTFVNVTDSVNIERALLEKNDALEQAGELKNTFIQHVSYELRSPLTNIIGFAQLLTDPKIGPLNEKQREYTGFILSSSSALLAIVNDILDLATVDAGIMELDFQEIDVAQTFAGAVEGLKDRLSEADIKLATTIADDVDTFIADEKRIRQILFNLLSNAIAHSHRGGTVRLDCRRDDDLVQVSVTDQGDGIPADQIDTVFDRFVSRVSGSGRRGAGLGLSIVKSFVELHGGDVELTSAEGLGTTITCHFPTEPDLPAFVAAE